MVMISQQPLDEAGALSVWLEVLLYGLYCTLFVQAVYVIWKKHMSRTRPAKVFLYVTIIMWILATIHIGLNLYRLLRGYVWLRDTVGPENYFLDLGRWDNVAHDLVNALTTWFADFLLIYRCFLVWNNNYYVIAVPTVLLCLSIVANSVALHLFTQVPLGTIFGPTLVHWMNTIYALALIQNTLTTGLIAYRIWLQDLSSKAIGASSTRSERSSLLPVVFIIIESAAIYVLELIVLIVLYALKHNAQFIVQEAVVPTVGIVFTLMTVRFAMRSSKVLMTTRPAGSTIGWQVPTHVQETGQGTEMVSATVGTASTNVGSSVHLKTVVPLTETGDASSEIKFAPENSNAV